MKKKTKKLNLKRLIGATLATSMAMSSIASASVGTPQALYFRDQNGIFRHSLSQFNNTHESLLELYNQSMAFVNVFERREEYLLMSTNEGFVQFNMFSFPGGLAGQTLLEGGRPAIFEEFITVNTVWSDEGTVESIIATDQDGRILTNEDLANVDLEDLPIIAPDLNLQTPTISVVGNLEPEEHVITLRTGGIPLPGARTANANVTHWFQGDTPDGFEARVESVQGSGEDAEIRINLRSSEPVTPAEIRVIIPATETGFHFFTVALYAGTLTLSGEETPQNGDGDEATPTPAMIEVSGDTRVLWGDSVATFDEDYSTITLTLSAGDEFDTSDFTNVGPGVYEGDVTNWFELSGVESTALSDLFYDVPFMAAATWRETDPQVLVIEFSGNLSVTALANALGVNGN